MDDIWARGPIDNGPWPPGWNVFRVAETGSTNDDLLDAARRGLVGGQTALYTGHQTAGRGRLDRRWEAPPGANLLVSILFDPAPERPAEPTQRVAVAASVAAESIVKGVRVGLKWPNDLVVDGDKIAGILAQRSGGSVVVGLGFNVAWSPEGATDLHREGGDRALPLDLLVDTLGELDQLANVPERVSRLYRERLVTLGQRVRVALPAGAELIGWAEDIDGDGRLIVVDDGGGRHVLDVGDVVHLRPGDA